MNLKMIGIVMVFFYEVVYVFKMLLVYFIVFVVLMMVVIFIFLFD